METPQDYSNHRAVPPLVYLIAGTLLIVEAGRRAWSAIDAPNFESVWACALCAAWVAVWWAGRSRAMVVQDRVIRLEMRLRLERLLGASRRAEIERLGVPQIVALRFASDEELPALAEEVFAGRLARPNEIKQRVRNWQADRLRV